MSAEMEVDPEFLSPRTPPPENRKGRHQAEKIHINSLKHGGGGLYALPPFFFAFYSKYHETTHT